MRILLTGAGGQLASDLRERFGLHEVHAYDHRALDVADRNATFQVVSAIRPDWLINAAAYNDVDAAETAVEAAFAVNGAGPGYLAEAAAAVGASILHISTDYVFDGRKGSAYTEEDRPNPLSVYARSKYEGEQRVMASGASACILRTAWLYGRHGKNFVKTILAQAQKGLPLKVVADQVGSPTSTTDLANAITRLVRTPIRGLYHVTNAGACSRFQFAQAIVRRRVEVLPITAAEAGRPAPRPANSSLVSIRWSSAGFAPLRSWELALDSFLASLH